MNKTTIGWREWVGLPAFGIDAIKAKIDTGARTSSLHAFGLQRSPDGRHVSFTIHPRQRSTAGSRRVTAEVIDERPVRNSGGRPELRPVIITTLSLGGATYDVEVNLTRRDAMGFRMLIGRRALSGRFLIDPGRSFLTRRLPKEST